MAKEKLTKELDISTPLGGQNSTVDLIHPDMGNISVKDMTNDDESILLIDFTNRTIIPSC